MPQQDNKIQKTIDICKDPIITETELEKVIRQCKELLLKCDEEKDGCETPACTDGSFSADYEKKLLNKECDCNGEILVYLTEIEINKTNILKSKDNQESAKLLLCYTEQAADTYDEINECLMAGLNQDILEMEAFVKGLKEMDTELDKQVMLVAENIKKAKTKVDLTYKAICEFEICFKSICQSKEENGIAKAVEPKFNEILKTFNDLCRETDEALVTSVKIVGLNSLNSVEKLEGRIKGVKNTFDLLKKDVETNAAATKIAEVQMQAEYIKATAEVRKYRYAHSKTLGYKRGAVKAFCYFNDMLKNTLEVTVKDKDDFKVTNTALDDAFDKAKG